MSNRRLLALLLLGLFLFVGIMLRDLSNGPYSSLGGVVIWFVPILFLLSLIVAICLGLRKTKAEPSRFRFRLRTMLLLVTACSVLLGIWVNWEYIPGTYYEDNYGHPRGTGMRNFHYDSGQLMAKEWYWGGLVYRAKWFRPDGTEIASEEYDKKSGGIGYYLRQDGSIKSKVYYVYDPADHSYLADGVAIYYRFDGSIEKTVNFKDGVKIEP